MDMDDWVGFMVGTIGYWGHNDEVGHHFLSLFWSPTCPGLVFFLFLGERGYVPLPITKAVKKLCVCTDFILRFSHPAQVGMSCLKDFISHWALFSLSCLPVLISHC
jgi:hypothetical protein